MKTLKWITMGLATSLILVLLAGVYKFNYLAEKEGYTADGNKIKTEVVSEQAFKNFEYEGNLDSNTVLIYSQGGPTFDLDKSELPYGFIKTAPIDKLKNSLAIYVHQYQTKYPKEFKEKEITFEQAKKYDEKTIEIFAETIKHFKNKGKKVYLVGISFGAFVLQDYLATHGSGDIEGAVIAVGRISLPKEFWETFAKGEEVFFKNGSEITQGEKMMGSTDDYTGINAPKIAAGLGYKRYEELLVDVDLSNIVYVYGELDEQVGRLSSEEIQFLRSKGVMVVKSEKNHSGAAAEYTAKSIIRIVTGKWLSKPKGLIE